MLKLATTEQVKFYEEILYPMQNEIFSIMESNKFYLTGGTCLSRFYYNHRYSDDLDFFFDGSTFPKQDFEAEFGQILNEIKKKFKLNVTINSEYFKRLFVSKNDSELKLEFIYEATPTIGERINRNGIILDTKDNVVTNKLTAIHGRKTYKDYFDLFFLLKEYKLSQIVKWSELKMVPLSYEDTLLALTDGTLRGDVIMIQEVSIDSFENFLNQLTKELLSHAKEIP
jgi:predicted nucleotidyltransferase component of viral defense system